jgi:hypothetical protein
MSVPSAVAAGRLFSLSHNAAVMRYERQGREAWK